MFSTAIGANLRLQKKLLTLNYEAEMLTWLVDPDESDDDSSLEDSLPPLPEPDRVSSASTISAVEVGL